MMGLRMGVMVRTVMTTEKRVITATIKVNKKTTKLTTMTWTDRY
jgi:hypothetical protein